MSLTLECTCSGNALLCGLASLTFELEINIVEVGDEPPNNLYTLTLYGNKYNDSAPVIVLDTTPGTYTYDLDIETWMHWWDTISVELSTSQTSNQTPSPIYESFTAFKATYHIREEFDCFNWATGETRSWVQLAYSTQPDDPIKKVDGPYIFQVCWAGLGVFNVIYRSASLSEVTGCSISDQVFKPKADHAFRIDMQDPADLCLCATGGKTGRYKFRVINGHLPCGVELDQDTGCFNEVGPRTCEGSNQITFRVIDLGGLGHQVGDVVTYGGTAYLKVDGVSLVRRTGGDFQPELVGTTMTVCGVSRVVDSYVNRNNIVLVAI